MSRSVDTNNPILQSASVEECDRAEVYLGPRCFMWKREGENVSLCTSDTTVTVVKLKIHVSLRNKKCMGNSDDETYWEIRSKKNFVKIDVARKNRL